MNKNFRTFAFCAVVFSFSFLVFRLPVHATTDPVSYIITVSATIGEPKLTLFGYSSPSSKVELRGNRVYEETITNYQGYFIFDRVFLPMAVHPGGETQRHPQGAHYPELCLTAIDTQSRISFPTCLPPLPVGPFDISVGPVLLPPTISLERGSFLPSEQISAQGATIPNSEVTIFLAYGSSGSTISLVPPLLASSLPKYQIRADQNGHFEFNLPANWPSSWRTFAAAVFLGSPTPKSNTLTFKVLSWWAWLWEKLRLLFFAILGFLKARFWPFIILAEIIIILWLKKKKRSSEADFYPLRQNSVFHSRLDKILRRAGSGDIKNRSA